MRGHGRDIWEMFSDFFREAAVLILVFGFLDRYMGRTENIDDPYKYGITIASIGVGSFLIGIACEFLRTWREED